MNGDNGSITVRRNYLQYPPTGREPLVRNHIALRHRVLPGAARRWKALRGMHITRTETHHPSRGARIVLVCTIHLTRSHPRLLHTQT